MGMNETLKAISDPVRRDILQMLKSGKKSAGEIADKFNLTGATVSYHLAKLKNADLIAEHRLCNCNYGNVVYDKHISSTRCNPCFAIFADTLCTYLCDIQI